MRRTEIMQEARFRSFPVDMTTFVSYCTSVGKLAILPCAIDQRSRSPSSLVLELSGS